MSAASPSAPRRNRKALPPVSGSPRMGGGGAGVASPRTPKSGRPGPSGPHSPRSGGPGGRHPERQRQPHPQERRGKSGAAGAPSGASLAEGAPAHHRQDNARLRASMEAARDALEAKSSFCVHVTGSIDVAAKACALVRSRVFPAVEGVCAGRGELRFEPMCEPIAVSDESSLHAETQLLRLRTLGACRPFCVAFVGAAYGAPIDRYHPELADEFPFVTRFPSSSLLDLELLYASQSFDPSGRHSSVVYFIDPEDGEPAPNVSGAQVALMERLRERIAASQLPIVRVASVEAAVQDLEERLPRAILDEFPASTQLWHSGHPHVAAASAVSFIETRGPEYIPLGGALDVITGFIDGQEEAFTELETSPPDDDDGPDGARSRLPAHFSSYNPSEDDDPSDDLAMSRKPLVLASEVPGAGGLTTLLAHWMWRSQLHRERPETHFVFFHFAGLSPHAGVAGNIAHRLLTELNRFLDRAETPAPFDLAAIARELSSGFAALERRGNRGLIVIDGLNDLIETDQALSWLPGRLPPCVRCVLSVGADTSLIEAIQERGWLMRVSPALSGAECAEFVSAAAERAGIRLPSEEAGSLRRALQESPSRATPGFVTLLMALLRAANPQGEPAITRMVLTSLLTVDDARALFGVLLERLDDRAKMWQPGLLRDALSLLRLSAHGLSSTELIHILAVSRTSFSSVFGGFGDILFSRLGHGSADGVSEADASQIRLNLSCAPLRDIVAERYLVDEDDVLRIRHVLVAHFGGFVTAIKYPSIESVVHCGADGEFARGCSELSWGLLNGIDREDVVATVSDVSVFRAMWSSDLRRDLHRLWQDVATDPLSDAKPGVNYWDNVMTTYWDSINSDGSMEESVRPVFIDLLVDMSDLCLSLYDEHVYKFLDLAVEIEEREAAASPSLAVLHQRLGVFYRTVGRSDDALDHFYQAFQMRLETVGNSEETCASIVDCGEILLEQGSEADAAAAFTQGASIAEAAGITEYSPSYARLLNNVGLISKREGNLAKAENCYRESLEIRRNDGSIVHPHTAVTLRNLGSVLYSLERYKEAKAVFKQALETCHRVHGTLAIATALCHEWLSDVLSALNDPESAVHAAMAERIRSKVERLREEVAERTATMG